MQTIEMRLRMFDLATDELGYNNEVKIRSYYGTLQGIARDALLEVICIAKGDKSVSEHVRDSVQELLLALPYGMTEAMWWQELYTMFEYRKTIGEACPDYHVIKQLRHLLNVLLYDVLYRINSDTYPDTDYSILRRCLIVANVNVSEYLELVYKGMKAQMHFIMKEQGFSGLVSAVGDLLAQ